MKGISNKKWNVQKAAGGCEADRKLLANTSWSSALKGISEPEPQSKADDRFWISARLRRIGPRYRREGMIVPDEAGGVSRL